MEDPEFRVWWGPHAGGAHQARQPAKCLSPSIPMERRCQVEPPSPWCCWGREIGVGVGGGHGEESEPVCVCMCVCSHSAEDYFPFENLFRKLQSQGK